MARWRRRTNLTLLTVALLFFTLIVIIPFIWMLLMSLRTTGEILNNPYGLPTTIRWQNYTKLFFDPDILFYRFFINSIFVTGFAILLTTILSTLGGYGFGRPRYNFKFRYDIYHVAFRPDLTLSDKFITGLTAGALKD